MKITADEARKITEKAKPKKKFKESKFYLFLLNQMDKVKLQYIYRIIKKSAKNMEQEVWVEHLSNNLVEILRNEGFYVFLNHFRHGYVIRWK